MRKFSACAPTLFFLAGCALFSSLILVWRSADDKLHKQETYFSSPIKPESQSIRLRNDPYGKGYFGASRNGKRRHKGIDVLARLGEPVLASKSGRIVFAGQEKGYGLFAEIGHFDGLRTRYAHLSRLYGRQGDWVARGDIIGTCGKTGNASAAGIQPHVHFEIITLYGALNPSTGLLDPQILIRKT